ncbi:hypothetical protein TUMSATVNIG1_17620 [Vibrio nigripulchritudo]|uniref:hypothetical protein n=1 Tax=Vibrio nigripulchritudo TaxID=28173 RepID=UPI00190D9F5A|nr:hypothetical protein [Vibrio nigripulchritudo]BCL69807.1 hypothetical protein VNTUMSATTG_17440 [Vibrio nigripulchritudo]BDU31153.1 hypothetical protein TUMSATVNIG1_17620 [Vibrio nigripulchritudo]
MSTQPFIFGGNTGRSYQDIKRIREQAEALKPSGRISGGMSGFGDGLSALGRALLYRMTTDKADKLEEKGRQSFNAEFNQWASQPDFKSSEIAQQSQKPPPVFGGIDPRLVKMSSNSFATPGQQALMQMVLKSQMDASAPADPLKQVQLQKAQLELEKMRNPERTIIQGADGFNYYQDTGERVLPGVEIPKDPLHDIQLQKAKLELAKAQIPQNSVDFDTEQKLRKEFSGLPTIKDFSSINDSWDRVQASAHDPSAAGDLALVFNYMKMLDPGSVVREGEFATAQNAAGIDERVVGMYNRILSGERLTPVQRQDFVSRAGQMFNAQAGNYNDAVGQYRGLADQYSLSPDRIANTVELYESAPQAATDHPQFADNYSQEDLEFTAKKHGLTIEQVLEKLGVRYAN